MSTLNVSTNGASINKSYQSIVNVPAPSGPAAQSPTYGQWAIFSVTAPLANAFTQDFVAKESLLKVQSTGEGELADLVEEFSDGRVQFAFVKVKDPNTTLSKNVLIAWCGEGVPERTKGYFTNYLAVVSKTLQGYHVQITARSDRDLTPESIVKKVSDASGSKYAGAAAVASGPPSTTASKPVITPMRSSLPGRGYNPLAQQIRSSSGKEHQDVDEDGWGHDAPPVTRTQLEKVPSSYQPTRVSLNSTNQQSSNAGSSSVTARPSPSETSDVVKGAYQPVGRVNIAEIRRQAKDNDKDDRPIPVKGSYEPVGKVDIAAIRARAQPPADTSRVSSNDAEQHESRPSTLSGSESTGERAASSYMDGRMTELPKPKVSHRFGASATSFAGTKAPAPGASQAERKPISAAPQSGVGRTFADQGGKTPAQVWAEKKARERGMSAGKEDMHAGPIASQDSGGGEWRSGYTGKSWATVQTKRTGPSSSEAQSELQHEEQPSEQDAPTGGFGAIRDKFSASKAIGSTSTDTPSLPPALDISSKPNAGQKIPSVSQTQAPRPTDNEASPPAIPSPPPQPPRSPTPPTPPAGSSSPIRVAMPVGRGGDEPVIVSARDELQEAPSLPTQSIKNQLPKEEDLTDEAIAGSTARAAGEAMATTAPSHAAVDSSRNGPQQAGRRALVQYDYERAEDNEIELKEGEMVDEIEMVDENWWMGKNAHGESGLFPSNYVELVEGNDERQESPTSPRKDPRPAMQTATALYDYEAAEDNEISFPENVQITDVEFPDEDWWSGIYKGKHGLFPANYVKLDE